MKSGSNASLVSRFALSSVLAVAAAGGITFAADHSDTPALVNANRRDALITDLHTFVREGRLVLSVCMNPAIPVSATSYLFPADMTLKILIDRDSAVDFSNGVALATYGGTVVNPAGIAADVTFQVTFADGVTPLVTATGISAAAQQGMRVYAGLRDDPFIRGPRQGRNVAAVVIDIPLIDVVTSQPTLLIWATSHVPDLAGPFQEAAGRALRNMFPENDAMNSMPPNQHTAMMGVPPDVIIYNTKFPAAFPNGRALTDDVVDLVGDPRVTGNDAPFPTGNDVPFLVDFPYLGFARGLEPPPVPVFGFVGAGALGLGMLLMLVRQVRRN
jgi:hypothetical protein